MEIISNVSERLTELMFYHGDMRSEALAREIGVTGVTVRGWMNGSQEISLKHAVAVADFFRCPLDFLTGRTEKFTEVVPRELPPFYPQIRKVMRETGVTRYAVVKNTPLRDSFFTNWAKGDEPRLYTVCTLANYLGVPLDYLIGRAEL